MTISITDTLRCMGISGIGEIASPLLMDILQAGSQQPNTAKLADAIVGAYGAETLLRDSTKRPKILQHLQRHEAVALARQLGVAVNTDDPWQFVNDIQPPMLPRVLKFFGISSNNTQDEQQRTSRGAPVQAISPSYGLFAHQQRAVGEIEARFADNQRSGNWKGCKLLLHMPTGSGKTRTSMHIVSNCLKNAQQQNNKQQVVLWLADTEELCDQAADEFQQAWSFLGVSPQHLYRFYGQHELDFQNIESGFMVAGLQKLCSLVKSNQSALFNLGSKLQLVIFDEAHRALAPTYKEMTELLLAPKQPDLLGLSATPGRSTYDEQENRALAEFFDTSKIKLKIDGYESPVDYLQDEGYLAKINFTNIPHEPSDPKLKNINLSSVIKDGDVSKSIRIALGNDAKRNLVLIKCVKEEVAKGSKIILFASSLQSAEAIYIVLKHDGLPVDIVTSKTPRAARHSAIDQYKGEGIDVLVNFGVLTTGFDAPVTNVAIIGRPTTSLSLYSQMVGRASRGVRAGGNSECTIYTVVDDLPGFRNMSEAFGHWDDAWVD